ncbi:MAG: thiamine pyrophosphate-requiring protein, partial [Vicinamibacterales bacterium]
MRVGDVIAEIMKRERSKVVFAYPLTPLTEYAAAADIRPIVVRQERVGCAMADAGGRLSSGDDVNVFTCQGGPGIENAFGAVTQAQSEGVPLVVIVPGPSRALANVPPSFSATLNFQHITKSAEAVTTPEMIVPALRRAFTLARNGRPGPCLVEVCDVFHTEVPSVATAAELVYEPTRRTLIAPDPKAIDAAAEALITSKMPLIYAGQGVHYAKAWPELRQVAELLEAPVATSMEGKSAFPETHALSLGAAGNTMSRALATHVRDSDVVFGVGVSFSPGDSIRWPTAGKRFIHNTVEERDINKIIPTEHPVLGDAKLTLAMLHQALSERLRGRPRGLARDVAARIQALNKPWLDGWMPLLTSNAKPLSPYRVIYDLLQTVDVANTVITHDAGSPRDEMIPFWKAVTPLSYLGWGKTTQLGYGLGLAMGAKVAHPDKLCINFWGEAAIGMTGMDFETCVRCQIPIMSILSNNFGMKTEYAAMKVSHAKYRTCDISGNYAEFAKAMGGYGERVTEPEQVVHAIVNGIRATKEGKP